MSKSSSPLFVELKAEPVTADSPELADPARDSQPGSLTRRIEAAMLLIAAAFVVLHFVHLKADFPNHFFWVDWAKYTDEGWYGDMAIRLFQLGHWNVPGDFNPGAALPVWPAMLIVLFRFTGVSLVAARALTLVVFALSLVCCYLLMRRWLDGEGDAADLEGKLGRRHTPHAQRSLAPAMTVLLLAVSPFCFAFMRLAILEPLLVLLMLASLMAATLAGEAIARNHAATIWPNPQALRWAFVLGVLFPLMVLTKTTAIFLLPAILWALFAFCGYRVGAFLRVAMVAGAVGTLLWGAYFELWVKPHYLADYHYLFSANTYTKFEWKSIGPLLFATLFDGLWIGKTLFALALMAMIGSIVTLFAKGIRANPALTTMILWILGYGAFLTYHANLQPRYYLVVVVPLTAMVTLIFEPVIASGARTWTREPVRAEEIPAGSVDVYLLRVTAGLVVGALLFAAGNSARHTLRFVLHPEYTWVNAAERVREEVRLEVAANVARSPLVLSISGSDISLMTGLPSICDDFGTMTLNDRIATYKPGFFATWNEVEDDKMEALAPMYTLTRVLATPALDDPDRNLLILYRLDPVVVAAPEKALPVKRRTEPHVWQSLVAAREAAAKEEK